MSVAFVIVVAVLIGVVVFLWRLTRPTGSEIRGDRLRWKRGVRYTLVLTLLIIAALSVWASVIEPNRLVLKQETIRIESCPPALDGLRIAVISDVHAGSPFIDENKLQRIVATVNGQQPDLVVILGDFLVRTSWHATHMEPEVIAENLKGLRAPLGVFAVLGNHDWWGPGRRMWKALDAVGIRVLENESASISRQGQEFSVVGLSDLWTRPQKVNDTLVNVPASNPVIAITHNPDIFPKVPASVTLTLAGHTHGGQVNFPILGRLVLPSDYRYAAGHVQEAGHHLFVTTGIGTSIFPVRFRVPPEVVLLTLTR